MIEHSQMDKQTLEELNIEIGNKETDGDVEWLGTVIAPVLAFQRANKITFDDRSKFLEKVKPGPGRVTRIESINIYGDRAIVNCIVTLDPETDPKQFHNLRLFVKQDGQWKLLGWANEPL